MNSPNLTSGRVILKLSGCLRDLLLLGPRSQHIPAKWSRLLPLHVSTSLAGRTLLTRHDAVHTLAAEAPVVTADLASA